MRKSVHFFILDILLFTICFLVVGVLGYGWYVMEISALFFAMGICCGIADNQSADDIAKLFLAGCKDILSAALVVGLASGIIFILRDGKVIEGRLGYTKTFSGKYNYRKPEYFTVQDYDFLVSHIKKIKVIR